MRTDVTAINAKSISVNGTPIAGSPAAFGQWTTFDQLDADVVLALNGVVIQGTIPPGGVVFTNYENVNVLSGAGLADSVIYGSPSTPASNASTGPLNPGSGGTPTPTPSPVFSVQPSISPNGGTAGTTFTASDGTASNTTGYTRRWLLNSSPIGTGTTVVSTAGSLVLEVTATGPGGSTIAVSPVVTVTAVGTLDNPRIAMVGPSTTQQNNYASNAGAQNRGGWIGSGTLAWALMKSRLGTMIIDPDNSSRFWSGDNAGVDGAVFSAYPGQLSYIGPRMATVPDWVGDCEIGRNDIPTATLAQYQTAINRDIADMRAKGAKRIMVAGLWNRPMAAGGNWVSGGSYRTLLKQINDFQKAQVAAAADLVYLDYEAVLCDNTTDREPFSWVYRQSDLTHYTNRAAEIAGDVKAAALATICAPRSYPSRPAESILPAFSGTGGTLVNGATGAVVDGWSLGPGVAGISVAGETFTRNGETWQRITISGTSAVAANGVAVNFVKLATLPVLTNGQASGFRCKVATTASGVPYSLYSYLGSPTNGGQATAHRAVALVGVSDATLATIVPAPGTDFATASAKFDARAKDLWLETCSKVVGAGTGLDLGYTIIVGPGSTDTLVVEIGQQQTFNWPVLPSPVFNDTFTGADGTTIQSRNADSGEAWTKVLGTVDATIQSNEAQYIAAVSQNSTYRSAYAFPSAAQYVEGTLNVRTTAPALTAWLLARSTGTTTFYQAGLQDKATGGAKQWAIGRTISGTYTQIAIVDATVADGTTPVVRFECNGTSLVLKVDGVTVLSTTNANITTAGQVGFRYGNGTTGAITTANGFGWASIAAGAL